jgi:hypothetical protein
MPFYAHTGTSNPDLTWQVAGGVTYAAEWGEFSAMWRFLAYDMKPGNALQTSISTVR